MQQWAHSMMWMVVSLKTVRFRGMTWVVLMAQMPP
jgi:hypothetical protein